MLGKGSGIFLCLETGSMAVEEGLIGLLKMGFGKPLVLTGKLWAYRTQRGWSDWERLLFSIREEHQEGTRRIGSWTSIACLNIHAPCLRYLSYILILALIFFINSWLNEVFVSFLIYLFFFFLGGGIS